MYESVGGVLPTLFIIIPVILLTKTDTGYLHIFLEHTPALTAVFKLTQSLLSL